MPGNVRWAGPHITPSHLPRVTARGFHCSAGKWAEMGSRMTQKENMSHQPCHCSPNSWPCEHRLSWGWQPLVSGKGKTEFRKAQPCASQEHVWVEDLLPCWNFYQFLPISVEIFTNVMECGARFLGGSCLLAEVFLVSPGISVSAVILATFWLKHTSVTLLSLGLAQNGVFN